MDVVNSVLVSAQTSPSSLSFSICDFKYAFCQVSLHESEHPYFCGKMDKEILCYRRTAQGSSTGPLAWADEGAFIVRLSP
eukprot:1232550-Amphidinium_carterae.2